MLWKSGMRITPGRLNDPADKPMCRLLQVTAGTSIPDNTAGNVATALLFDTEDYDTHGFHSTSSGTSRITIPASAGDGVYLCKGTVFFPALATYTTLGAVVMKNAANQPPWARIGPNATAAQRTVDVEARLNLIVGDYVELGGWQDNTANVAAVTSFGSSFECVFEVEKLRGPA